jgi:UDP-N-acetylmuramyl-tripeptide synthetase
MALHELPSVDAALAWLAARSVRALTTDSRRVQRGDAFIAWPGYAVDGRQFVGAALAAGASACLVEAEGASAFGFDDAERIAALRDLKPRTGLLASAFLGDPSARLQVFAVTGTNGKTSTSWWVAQALSVLGQRCGVIGTLGVGEPPVQGRASSIAFTGLTTPDPITVQAGFKRFADAGLAACAIEATSIGIIEQRLAGSRIAIALFTNFTQDHLDYHHTMDAYWDAKAQLFAWPGLKAAVLNVDDARGAALAAGSVGNSHGLDVWTYSTQRRNARLCAVDAGYVADGLAFDVVEGDARVAVRTRLIGDYNVANLLAVIGGLRAAGIALADAAQACATLTPVPGRMDRVPSPAGPSIPQGERSARVGTAPDPVRAEVSKPSPAGPSIPQGERSARVGSAPDPVRAEVSKPSPAGPSIPQGERSTRVGSAPDPVRAEVSKPSHAGPSRPQGERSTWVGTAPDPVRAEVSKPSPASPSRLPEVVVDYAHTPDALEKALQALQPLAAQRGGALWCVFGCGGNRDAGKRPVMGAIAQRLAQHVVVTSDNPRLEDPNAIIEQIVAGFVANGTPPMVIANRAAAIAHAVAQASARDVILLAGKGHEDYQDAGGVKHPFSDLEQAAAALARRGDPA